MRTNEERIKRIDKESNLREKTKEGRCVYVRGAPIFIHGNCLAVILQQIYIYLV